MQSSIGTTKETSTIMRLMRTRTKAETKEFMDDFSKHLKIVLDSLEGTQKVFWLIESDMIKHTVTIRLGATLGIDDLPSEVRQQLNESERQLRAKEDGDGKTIIQRTDEVFQVEKQKPVHLSHTEKIQQQYDEEVRKDGEKE